MTQPRTPGEAIAGAAQRLKVAATTARRVAQEIQQQREAEDRNPQGEREATAP